MLKKFKQFLLKEEFKPSFISIFISPFYFIRRGLYKGLLKNKDYLSGILLDFGCGSKPYESLFNVQKYIGIDIEISGHPNNSKKVDVYYDGITIPFDDNYFDSVFSSEVFEHVFNLEHVLNELFRVIKPGGNILITIPFVWFEHEIPYDFARYTSYGIDYLLKNAGFEVVKIEKTTNYIETVFQMWNAYFSNFVLPKNIFFKAIMRLVFITPVTVAGIVISKILPDNRRFYNNSIIIAKKTTSTIK